MDILEFEKSLQKALDIRNCLAHRYFAKNSVNLVSSRGREEMIEELRRRAVYLRDVDAELEKITHVLWRKLGLTDDVVAQFETLRRRSKEQDKRYA